MNIEPGSKLLMIGDSITDANRVKPVGEGLFNALGQGYVALVDGLLAAAYPHHRVRVVNMGLSGNTVRDLKARWQADVLDLKPDWLSLLIGINDVWRQFDLPLQHEIHVGLDEYETTLSELAALTRPALKGLVLMTPFYIEPNRQDAMRRRMDQYGAAVRRVADQAGAIFVDTQAAFDRVLATAYPAALAWDRVHPGIPGHMVLAKAFLDALGFRWNG